MRDINDFPDAHLRVFERPEPPSTDSVDSIYLIGICGTGMGSLAGLLREAGYRVVGSDAAAYPPMSLRLEALGIPVHEGYDAAHLDPQPDLVVVGNACTPTHVEAAYARENVLAQMSLPEAVRYFFLEDRNPVVIAGTHGKTTTTGLTVHLLTELGLDPGFLVGGVLKQNERSYAVGNGKYFVIEGDEYDSAYFDKRPKFMHYRPHIAVVTSLEYDHVDIFEDFDDYVAAFERFTSIIDPAGCLVLNGDDDRVGTLAKSASPKVIRYGLNGSADISAANIAAEPGAQFFDLHFFDENLGRKQLPMHGRHNLLNALAAIGAAVAAGADPSDAADALTTFKGLKRRQDVILQKNGVAVIDDFAHHPTAVQETVNAVRQKYPNARLVAVFEPRSNSSRRKVFEQPYIEAFSDADAALISSPPFRHNDNLDNFMDTSHMVRKMNESGVSAAAHEKFDDLFNDLTSRVEPGDVVLIMSNGGFHDIHNRLATFITDGMQKETPRIQNRTGTSHSQT